MGFWDLCISAAVPSELRRPLHDVHEEHVNLLTSSYNNLWKDWNMELVFLPVWTTCRNPLFQSEKAPGKMGEKGQFNFTFTSLQA